MKMNMLKSSYRDTYPILGTDLRVVTGTVQDDIIPFEESSNLRQKFFVFDRPRQQEIPAKKQPNHRFKYNNKVLFRCVAMAVHCTTLFCCSPAFGRSVPPMIPLSLT